MTKGWPSMSAGFVIVWVATVSRDTLGPAMAGIGAVVHFLWLVKADLREPLIYGAILLALLATRVPWRRLIRQ